VRDMKSMKGIQHVYQRADDWGVIFYTDADRLVYYTTCCVMARKYSVRVLAASIMYTHIHQSLTAPNMHVLSKYVQDATSSFARQYNHHWHRVGALFHRDFGRSWKRTDKEIRNNLAYVFNNHVEKQLCHRAEDIRWSFLAYANSKHPFSEKLDFGKASSKLARAMKMVARRSEENAILKYRHINELFSGLDKREAEQLTDYIVVKYGLIDYDASISCFGGYEKATDAFASMTGGDYKIAEEFVVHPDTWYVNLVAAARDGKYLNRIYALPHSEKAAKYSQLVELTGAPDELVGKFLHYSTVNDVE